VPQFARLLVRPSARLLRTSEAEFVAVTVPLGALEERSSAPNEDAASSQAERPFSTGETRLGASWGATRSAGAPQDSHAPPGRLHGGRVPGRTADRRGNAVGLAVQIAAVLKGARSRPGRRPTTGYPRRPARGRVALRDPAAAEHGAVGIAPERGRTRFARPADRWTVRFSGGCTDCWLKWAGPGSRSPARRG
jgi:hypothetical protein